MKPNWLSLFAVSGTFAGALMFGSTLSAALQPTASAGPAGTPAPLTRASFTDRTDAQIARLLARVEAQASDAPGWAALGAAYLDKARETADPGFSTKAEGAYRTALQHQPANIEALTGLGQLALNRHQFTEALEWGLQAQAAAPASPQVYGVMGDALLELGRFEEAFAAFQVMVDLRPDLPSYARASYARELLGNIDGAIEAMDLAARAGGIVGEPAAWARVHLGNLWWDYRGNTEAAGAEYEKALFAYPDYAAAHAGLARLAAGALDLRTTELYARKAAQYQPSTEHLLLLAEVLEAAGRPTEAARQRSLVRTLEAAAKAAGADNDLELAELDADLAVDPAATLQRARDAYALRPSAKAAEILAWAAYRAGEVAEARDAIARPLALGVKHPLTLYRAAAIASAAAAHEGARSLVEQVLAANPNFSIRYAEDAARLQNLLQQGVAR